jgi:serine phosphatase RsbU (regulator of sigma subunit)
MTALIGNRAARLLVVDDNEMNRDMLSRRLVKQGHQVEMAENGAGALQKLGETDFDLVLLDIMMPEMDGYEVLGRIKGDDRLRHIPVVMISAVGETESVVRCIELGADDYLPKPFNPVVLRARVNASLDKKRLHDRERVWAESLERELEIGRRIQQGFFPGSLPKPAGWEIAAHFEPARQVAGDFYDAFDLPGGAAFVVIADVCDKGVGAALYMALFRSLIRALATEDRGERPEALLLRTARRTNDYIATIHGDANMFATAFLAVIDPAGHIHYVNAGHEEPMILHPATIERLAPTGPALGLMPDVSFTVASRSLASGELLFAFTDGVTEAKGADGFYGQDRLDALCGGAESAVSLVTRVADSVKDFEHGERADDITLLALSRV